MAEQGLVRQRLEQVTTHPATFDFGYARLISDACGALHEQEAIDAEPVRLRVA